MIDRQSDIELRFNALSDYLWKLPTFIEQQRVRETAKLDQYFPYGPDDEQSGRRRTLRNLRAEHEFGKLDSDFPDFMGSAAFIHLVSLFEYHLLDLCREMERGGAGDLEAFRGRHRGVARLLAYAEEKGSETLPEAEVAMVQRAITLRNCLAHANGMLSEFKGRQDVRSMVVKRLCYDPQITGGEPLSEDRSHEPSPRTGPLGERLMVPIEYTHWLCTIMTRVLRAVCSMAS